MKFITKQKEPAEFREWKELACEDWQPDWDNLAGIPKNKLHKALLAEQGHICCYCNRLIDETDSHIEHLVPRSQDSEKELDYNNMLASCQRRLKPKEPRHCGALKDEWYDTALMVSPLQEDCETRFLFIENGDMLPASEADPAAQATIEKLGLNIDKLRAMRSKAIDSIIDVLDGLTSEEIKAWIAGLQKKNSEGRFEPFCQTLIQILQSYTRGIR
ncbi:retron system putative HNH endonuclease [Desulfobacterales bacterium HSG2]|nr:retron system putative HNH endonuclease [Desulfobacterales bacterium HSG2]